MKGFGAPLCLGKLELVGPVVPPQSRQIVEPSMFDISENIKNQQNDSDISDWQTYRNEKYGFLVKYPTNYSEHYKIQDGLLSQYALDETVSLVTQRKFGNDLITSPVNITIYRNPTDMTAMEWISNNLGSVTRTTENSVVLYEYNRPGKELLTRATFLTKNINPDFIIEFSFELEYFGNLNIYPSDEQYIQTYNQILSTFKFINSKISVPAVDQNGDKQCVSNGDCERNYSCWYEIPKGPSAGTPGSQDKPGQCINNAILDQI